MSSIVVQQLDKTSPFVEKVRILADKNAATLGFLPYQAFEEYAAHQGILAAIDIDEDKLAGYLIFRVVKQHNKATIVHLCIESSFRGMGIARLLFNELREKSQTLYGIGLLCRRDYEEATRTWRKLGFVPVGEKQGRRQKIPSELTFWWFANGQGTLFDTFTSKKTRVVIDANIFFDLHNTKTTEQGSLALKADWLREEVELLVTPELLVEIDKNSNSYVRKQHRANAQAYLQTKNKYDAYNAAAHTLIERFPILQSEHNESDLKQLAWSVADPDVHLFVTRDEGLIKLATQIFEFCGLSVMHPVDLILQVDELYRIDEYRNMRLAGTHITQRRIQTGQSEDVAKYFQNSSIENKAEFLKLLREHLVERDTISSYVIEDTEGIPLLLFSYDRSDAEYLTLPLLRITSNSVDKKLLRFFLLESMTVAARENRNCISITDPRIHDLVKEALQEDTFIQHNNTWYKLVLPFVSTAQETAFYLDSLLNKVPDIKRQYQLHIQVLQTPDIQENVAVMSEIERTFWPLKIIDAAITTITIPIIARWASAWFDNKLASQTLFGAQEERAFNREGVYYSAAKPLNITLPGRILWYVTKDVRLPGTQAIRACSRLDNIVTGKPKDLFRQFQHLGIYEWRDIAQMVGNDLEREITAYRFSDTEMFHRPVDYSEWQATTLKIRAKNPPIQSPAIMPSEIFEQIYKKGMEE